MNENPRMLAAFCLEKYSIANRVNMLVQTLANMLARFAGASFDFDWLISYFVTLFDSKERINKI